MGGMVERVGAWLFRAVLRLLPRELRGGWGEEMLHAFRERQADLRSRRSPLHLPLLWLRELAGLLRTAYRARIPDRWSRRTAIGRRRTLEGGAGAPSTTLAASPDAEADLHTTHDTSWSTAVDHLTSDLRFAARAFLRKPGMMGLAALSLALGIGASTAMFSVVDSVLLRPLPSPAPDELVRVYPTNPELRNHPTFAEFADRGTFSEPEYWWVQENQGVLEGMGLYLYQAATLTGAEGPPEQLRMVGASADLLPVLGVEALRGRLLGEEDVGEASLMLTEEFWRSRFAGDPGVVGTTVRLDDAPWTVVGVLPSSVEVATFRADAWRLRPGSSAEGNWGNHNVNGVIARLPAGVGLEEARAELARIMAEAPGDGAHGHGAAIYPALQDMTRDVRPALIALIAGAGILLLVGCGNVAAILLGAGIEREQEIAVRGSLGASRGRLAAQLLTESLFLAGMGAVGGLALAWLISQGLIHLAPPGVPRIGDAALNGKVAAFAVAAAALAGLVFGVVPALSLSRPDLSSAISSSRGTTSGRGRLQSAVVVGELALATVLLISAGLLGRSLFALNSVDLGLDPEGLYAVRVAPPFQRFQGDDGFAAMDQYLVDIQQAIQGTPGVLSVAMTSDLPLTGDRANNDVIPEGWDPEAEDEALIAERRFVSDGYFATAGIDLVEGRGFEAADNRTDAAPVMVISEGLARRVWPDEPAVGKQMSYWGRDPSTVVGVARDLRDESATRASTYAFYAPARTGSLSGSFLVRIGGGPSAVLPAIRQSVWQVAPDLPITRMTAMDELFSETLAQQRYRARLMVAFAALAALFAMMGVYGVVSRNVARRTREMGIRMALGAERSAVRGMVLKQGMRLALQGALLGVLGAAAVSGLLEGLLYEVEPLDPVVLGGIALLVAAASVLATLPPSFRATRVDPSEALRSE